MESKFPFPCLTAVAIQVRMAMHIPAVSDDDRYFYKCLGYMPAARNHK